MTAEDEATVQRSFVLLAETGDPVLRAELISAHSRVATDLARRYANRGPRVDAILPAAHDALERAVDTYDPGSPSPFPTYAERVVGGELRRRLQAAGSVAGGPNRWRSLFLRLCEVASALARELGRSPTIVQVAARVLVSEEEVVEALESGEVESAAEAAGAAGWGRQSRTLDESSTVPAPSRDSDAWTGFAGLPTRERVILSLRFQAHMSWYEIGATIGVSPLLVPRIAALALEQLRSDGAQADGTREASSSNVRDAAQRPTA
jgi:RNA polymerase sigma-B factor